MARRQIFMHEEPILRMTCHRVESFNNRLWELLDDLHETMDWACACGLAANQVGIRRQVFVFNNAGNRMEFVNPKIIRSEGESIAEEGCVSFPGEFLKVKRPSLIEVVAQDRQGEEFSLAAENLDARIICHETDHLFGIIFKDLIIANK